MKIDGHKKLNPIRLLLADDEDDIAEVTAEALQPIAREAQSRVVPSR